MADYCADCFKVTVVDVDRATGDSICTECGLVLESRYIDETSEWRSFADDTEGHDPNRVGAASNPLLGDALSATIIAGAGADTVGRLQNRVFKNPNKQIIEAFQRVDEMGERLTLPAIIKDQAKETYKKLADLKTTKGRNLDAMLAACLLIACRQQGKPRTVKEICSVAYGVGKMELTKRELARSKDFIVKQLGMDLSQAVNMGTIQAGDFLRRFCSFLGMTHQAVKAAEEAVHKSAELDLRRSPITIAATVIYLVNQLSGEKKPLRDISNATGVAESTIKETYNDLYPYASRLIPTSFASKEDLMNLCIPQCFQYNSSFNIC